MVIRCKKIGIACTLGALVLVMSICIPTVAALDMMYRANPQHTALYDSYSGGIVPNGQYKWSFQTGGMVHSSPAVSNAVVFVGSDDTYVRAIRAFEGTLKWSFKTGGKVESSPAVVDGIVYVGSDDGSVYAIDAETGLQKWRYYTGGPVLSSPSVAKGVVFVGSDDKNIYAIDANTGQKIWSRLLLGSVRLSPAVANGLVYTGDPDYIYGLDAEDGRIVWNTHVVTTYQASSPAIGNGLLYIWAEEDGGWLEAYDALTGEYKFMSIRDNEASSAAVTPNVVYIGASAVDAQTGYDHWTNDVYVCTLFCFDEWGSSPAVSNGIDYVGGKMFGETTNYLYAFHTNDGSLSWRYSTGTNKIRTSPAVYAGMVIFGCDDGKIYAVGNQPAPQPTISAVIPDSGVTNTMATNVTIYGTGLLSASFVNIKFKATPTSLWSWRDASNVRYLSDHQITCDFDLTDIPPGTWTMEVGTIDGKWAETGFSVIAPPVITVMVPNGGESWQAGSSHAVTWAQQGLSNTNMHIDLWKNWPTGVHVLDIAASVPATAGSYTWTIPADVAPSAFYWVNISSLTYPTINDYTNGWLQITTPPAPVVTGIAPNHGEKGTQVFITNLAGTNFLPGDQVAVLSSSMVQFEAVDVVVESPTKITCTFRIPSSALSGLQDVRVGNASRGYGVLKNGFTVDPGYVWFTFSPYSVPLGKSVHIHGVNTDNSTTYLYLMDLTELTCDPNGCPLTDLTKKVSDGFFTTVPNAADDSFAYVWDTSAATGLVPGTYGIIVTSDPVDFAHLTGHQYVKGSILIDKELDSFPGCPGLPTDPDLDGIHEDLNANGRLDFADVVLYFNQMTWLAANEPVSAFDLNGNGRIDFADIVALFNEI